MTITFNEINTGTRIPGTRIEINSSKAVSGLGVLEEAIIFGQLTSSGTATALSINSISSVEQSQALFGVGSQLADTIELFVANNPNIPITAVPLDDAGTNASKTITVTGTATTAATLVVYIGGRKINVPVNIGDDANSIAAAIEAAIDTNPLFIMAASVTTNVVTLVSLNQGEWTEKIPVAISPFTFERGGSETAPEGVTFVIVSTVTGTGNPDLTAAMDAAPDEIFNYWVNPYNDAANLTALDTELVSRFNGNNMFEGHAFSAFLGDFTAIKAHGLTRNSKHNTTQYAEASSLSPEHHWAAAYAGAATAIAQIDAALPWHAQRMFGILPGFKEDRLSDNNRNTLLFSGIATHTVGKDGSITIEYGATNYQKNTLGNADESFLRSQTLLTLSFVRQAYRTRLDARFIAVPHKLVGEGAIVSGSGIASPEGVEGEVLSLARELETAGFFELVDQWGENIIVERSGTNLDQIAISIPPDLINQLRQFAMVIEFRL